MKAAVRREYGDVSQLRLESIEPPAPGRGEVLVRVRAAAVDAGTLHLMAGVPYVVRLGFGIRRPRQPVPGRDLAGIVVDLGPDVDQFTVGDHVVGIGSGALAEYAVAPAKRLVRLPDGMDFTTAAAVPISGITALQALRRGRVERDDRVLVLGASGGVGCYTVLLASECGAQVTAVCSAAKADAVRSWGAKEVVAYDQVRLDDYTPEEPFDAVIDIAGDLPVIRLRSLLAPSGRLVIVGGSINGWLGMGRPFRAMLTSPFVKQDLFFFVSGENTADIETMITKVSTGEIQAPVDRVFDLADARSAIQYLSEGKATGKIAVRIPEADAGHDRR